MEEEAQKCTEEEAAWKHMEDEVRCRRAAEAEEWRHVEEAGHQAWAQCDEIEATQPTIQLAMMADVEEWYAEGEAW